MTRVFLAALALLAATTASAAAQALALPPVIVLTDTASARVEVRIPDGRALAGVELRGSIVGEGESRPLWTGTLGRLAVGEDGSARLSTSVTGLRPRLWSPTEPNLYRLTVRGGPDRRGVRESVRFGFRSLTERDGGIFLNGEPIFLRGNAINPPERTLPDSLGENPAFARDYLRYLKGIGVNIVRFTRPSTVWFEAADEVGMMVFQGHYGTPRWGTSTSAPSVPFEQSLAWYRDEVVGPQANHPSIVIYTLSNEQAAPEISYLTRGHQEVDAFLRRVHLSLREWDPTRLYIGNAGYGFGRAGEICDIHRYWGWYYNSFLSFYTLRDPRICWRTETPQPITLTENVGNYTGPDGRFNLVSQTKQPDSQLNWTGHAPDAEQSERALEYQAFVAKQAIEITRRLRPENRHLTGLMPFTILFRNWWGITRFEEMGPKPVADQYAVSFQPVLLSWELWTPQVYAGSTVRPVAHVVNDSDDRTALRGAELVYTLSGPDGAVHAEGRRAVPDVAYYATTQLLLEIGIPSELPAGEYLLRGRLVREGATVSHNETQLFVAPTTYAGEPGRLARRVVVHDPAGATRQALSRLGVQAAAADPGRLDPRRELLVIGSRAWDSRFAGAAAALRRFVAAGGRVLVLDQDSAAFDAGWLPAAVELRGGALDHPNLYPGGRPFRNAMAVNPERPTHPVFSGLDRDRLFLWSDHTGWRQDRPGFPAVYPVVQGFTLADRSDLARTAVLANYDHGLEGIALAELFDGRGSVLLSGFGLVERAGLDPAADRLLLNMVRYMASAEPHHAHPLIDSAIAWGDFASERGLVTDVYSGLLLNTVPVVPEGLRERYPLIVDEQGFHLAAGPGGWNTRPSIQYVPRGRRPYGPFEFSLGGSVRLPRDAAATGEGTVHLRVPSGRTRMTTTVWNPHTEALELEVELNGETRRHRIAAGAEERVETSLPRGARDLALTFRGDRRLVLLETDFR